MERAARHERSGERTTRRRNSHRDHVLETRVGSLQLRSRSCGGGAASKRSWRHGKCRENALIAVIQEAWIPRVSARRGALGSSAAVPPGGFDADYGCDRTRSGVC